jgi:formate-dependent nitrite reductase membrane component NrfD
MTMLFFYLAVVFYLVAWAGSVAFVHLPPPASASAVWNKVFAIACLIAGLIAALFLTMALAGRPLTN